MTGGSISEVILTPDAGRYLIFFDSALADIRSQFIETPAVYVVRKTDPRRPSADPQSLFEFASLGCHAGHERTRETELERAVRQYNEGHPDQSAFFLRTYIQHLFAGPFEPDDDTTGPDTTDCSASGGGSWSDFMARLDEAIQEAS